MCFPLDLFVYVQCIHTDRHGEFSACWSKENFRRVRIKDEKIMYFFQKAYGLFANYWEGGGGATEREGGGM